MVEHVIQICDVILGPHNVRNGSYRTHVQNLPRNLIDNPVTLKAYYVNGYHGKQKKNE